MRTIIALLALLALVGCSTVNPTTGQKEFDPIKTEQVKAAVHPVVSGGVRRAVSNSPQHAVEIGNYLRSVGGVFCSMKATGKFDPASLIAMMDQIPKLQFQDSFATDIRNVIVALYVINYGSRFNAELSPEKWPIHVADVFCSAIDQGLKDAGQPGIPASP